MPSVDNRQNLNNSVTCSLSVKLEYRHSSTVCNPPYTTSTQLCKCPLLSGEMSEITVICTAGAVAFLSFTFGVVTGGTMHYCIYISARKKKSPRPCAAEHEQQLNPLTPQTAEIELNQNVAYEAVLPVLYIHH